jgi:hypothetical protein
MGWQAEPILAKAIPETCPSGEEPPEANPHRQTTTHQGTGPPIADPLPPTHLVRLHQSWLDLGWHLLRRHRRRHSHDRGCTCSGPSPQPFRDGADAHDLARGQRQQGTHPAPRHVDDAARRRRGRRAGPRTHPTPSPPARPRLMEQRYWSASCGVRPSTFGSLPPGSGGDPGGRDDYCSLVTVVAPFGGWVGLALGSISRPCSCLVIPSCHGVRVRSEVPVHRHLPGREQFKATLGTGDFTTLTLFAAK